jgi:HK97 family phage major capsid protein
MSNEEILKAITAAQMSSSAGIIQGEQADKFIDMTIEDTQLLQVIRRHKTNKPSGELDKLSLDQPVSEGAAENTDTGNTSDVAFSKIPWVTTKLRSAFDLSTEALEDNIEGQGLKQTVTNAFSKRIGNDHELLAIQGDKTAYAGNNTAMGRLLKVLDGFDVLTRTGCRYVDAAGANISKNIFSKMIKAMPVKYRNAGILKKLRFFVSPTVYQDYLDTLTERQTSLGDQAITGGREGEGLKVFNIPVIPVSAIPENLGASTDQSWAWLTFPENFIWVVQREIQTHWEFKPRADRWENTTYTRIGNAIENKDAIVRANNIKLMA